MKKISLLGSTGSIGTQTLSVVREHRDELEICALAAHSNITLLEEQCREFLPGLVCVYDEKKAEEFRVRTADLPVRVVSGMDGLIEAAAGTDADVVLTAVVGMIGLKPAVEAIRAGKDLAFANKETLVTAGQIILPLIRKYGVRLLPVDSEHSAVFQCLNGENRNPVSRILLTASGGPFRGYTREQLAAVRREDALKHPNWKMGNKITIDSATLVNKGLEVMEAHWLFDVPYEKIEVVVQPQSVIHSMVEFEDGAIMAELGTPDMRIPIEYALFYPERRKLSGARLSFSELKYLSFEKPDTDVFPALSMAYEAGKAGGNRAVVYNAANEFAVSAFLRERIPFTEITGRIAYALEHVPAYGADSIEAVLETERETIEVLSCLKH